MRFNRARIIKTQYPKIAADLQVNNSCVHDRKREESRVVGWGGAVLRLPGRAGVYLIWSVGCFLG